MSLSQSAHPAYPAPAVTRFTVAVEGRELPVALAVVWASPAGAPDLATQAARWLRGEERDRYARFAVEHARGDFLAGRIAAKTAVQALAPQTRAEDWEIVRGIWHQPSLRGPVAGLAVTLAHAGGIGLAVAFDDRWWCGIDIETSTRDAVSAIESQVTVAEATWAREGATPREQNERWLLLWTAREAQGKCLHTGLLFPHALVPAHTWQPAPHGWRAKLGESDLLGVRAIATPHCVVSLVAPSADAVAIDVASAWLAARLE